MQEIDQALEDGAALAADLRAQGLTDEADRMDAMVKDMKEAKEALAAVAHTNGALEDVHKKAEFANTLDESKKLAAEVIDMLEKTGYKAEAAALSELLEQIIEDNVVTAAESEQLRDDVQHHADAMVADGKRREGAQIRAVAEKLDQLWRSAVHKEAGESQRLAKTHLQDAIAAADEWAHKLEKINRKEVDHIIVMFNAE